MKLPRRAACCALFLTTWSGVAAQEAATTHIVVDVQSARHPISPLIYGVNYGTTQQLRDLRAPVNRSGGDAAETYNYEIDGRNSGRDWYFESYPADHADITMQYGDSFVDQTFHGGSAPMLTIPMVGWVTKLGPNRSRLAAYSVKKYGAQQAVDPSGYTDAGNGVRPDGSLMLHNDPNDAMMPDSLQRETAWMQHNLKRWNSAAKGGIPYYLLGNEPSRWHDIHRHVHPVGTHASELAAKTIALANMVHHADASAKVLAPEEWAPVGTTKSGFDQQIEETHSKAVPDRVCETGGMDLFPWLLTQWKKAGHPVDIVSVHYYPQHDEYSHDVSGERQQLRNRSTRGLWDKSYQDIPWKQEPTDLIASVRAAVDHYYWPGTPIAITEYGWGADKHMNGATAQADVLGIFGREGVYLATRWIVPPTGTPAYLAMKLFRNYDDKGSGFGDISVSAKAPDPDKVSAFAAERSSTHSVTILLVNKQLRNSARVSVQVQGGPDTGDVETITLANGKLSHNNSVSYEKHMVETLLPPQSVTLLVIQEHVRRNDRVTESKG